MYRWRVEGTSGCRHHASISLVSLVSLARRETGDSGVSRRPSSSKSGSTADARVGRVGRRVGRSVVGAREVAMTDEATNAAERGSATTATRARGEDVEDEDDGFEKIALGVGAAE